MKKFLVILGLMVPVPHASCSVAHAQVLPLPRVDKDMTVSATKDYYGGSPEIQIYKPKDDIRLDDTLDRLLFHGFFERLEGHVSKERFRPTAVFPHNWDGTCLTITNKYQHENPADVKKHEGFIPKNIPETKTDIATCFPPANGMGPK